MQNKQDVEQEIVLAFKELVKTVPISKITIKEITDRAHVIRPTFYNHFQDKYELIERIVRKEILDPVRPLLANEMIDEAMVLIFTNLLKEKELYTKLARMSGQNSFEEITRNCVEELLSEMLEMKIGQKVVKDKWLTPQMLSRYYAQSMTFVVINWIESGMPLSPHEIAEIYNYILTRSMKDLIEELQEM